MYGARISPVVVVGIAAGAGRLVASAALTC